MPVLGKQIPDKIVMSASHTLLTTITTVRATFLYQSPPINKLFHEVANGSCNKLEEQAQRLIYKALSNLLLLPWPNTPEAEQKWEARSQSHAAFVKSLLGEFFTLQDNFSKLQTDPGLAERAKPVIHRAIVVLQELVESIRDEVVKSRELCNASLASCINFSFQLFPVYINQPDVSETLMSFFLTLFSALRRQIGVQTVGQTVQGFLTVFTTEQLQATILSGNAAGVRVVEKFIQILELIIDEPGKSFKAFTPSIIVLAVEQIYPIVSQRESPEVKEALFHLLHHILSKRHRYFFPSPVIASMLVGDESNENNSLITISHKPQFLAIMTAFGQSFLQSDITVFRQNLLALEDLNNKQKLYSKLHGTLREEGVLFQFINVLIQTLVNKSHDLLQEEICQVVYNMSTVDWGFFYSSFLTQFLQNAGGTTNDQKNSLYQSFRRDQDLPSFVANLERFVNDLRYYRLCNVSLPDGTVQF